MNKKLIVHIGTPKTGSSYLQELCVKNFDTLLAAGILYPGIESGEFIDKANVPINASNILDVFLNETNREETISRLSKKLNAVFSFNVNTVLISDETLSAFNVQNKGNLYIFECLIDTCNALSIDIKFLAFFREPSKYLPSHWAQLVKNHNETSSLVDFIKANKIPYWGHLLALHEIHNEISIFSYDKEIKNKKGILASFFEAIGVNPNNIEPLTSERINTSLSLNSLTALRLINSEFEGDIINLIGDLLTNAKPKYRFDKPGLSREFEKEVNDLYKCELMKLHSISN